MIIDARRLPEGASLEADICVIGAGAAGLTIARHFAGSRHKVCLLESGGRGFEYARQRLSRGVLAGQEYEPLDLCRVRKFGGSTGKKGWGGWCKPLSQGDFAERAMFTMSGWPITRDTLTPYYAKASETLGIPPDHSWHPQPLGEDADSPILSEPVALAPWAQMGVHALEPLEAAANINVLLYATVAEIQCGDGTAEVQLVRVRTGGRHEISVNARYFVLASGGIENARLLLLSDKRFPAGIGNEHDLVGRYFMEHPRVRWGHMSMAHTGNLVPAHDPREAQQAAARGAITPEWQHPIAGLTIDPAIREREGLLGSRSWIKPNSRSGHNPAVQALQELTFWPRKGRRPPNVRRKVSMIVRHGRSIARALSDRLLPHSSDRVYFSFDTILEQEPDASNRVTLDSKVDAHGQRQARLEWHLSPLLEHTLWRTQQILTQEAGRLGYDCHRGAPDAPGGDELQFRWVRHHMGTTRMSDDPKTGVVNADCRIFGVPNLFVAGSSVFPTGGNDMPTMTIVALAHRLAAHLEAQL
jgi:choline dehydrogenase-like flavoprotein